MTGGADTVAFIGFGEVGQTLTADLTADLSGGSVIRVWDRLFTEADSLPARAIAQAPALTRTEGMADAVAAATTIISAVTAANCVAAAEEAAASLPRGAWYLDLNSVSPGTRREAARHIEDAGGRFVEAAIMAPIAPRRIASPMLLGGPHAQAFVPVAWRLGFAGATAYAEDLGRASAAKMCRSVMIKGIEALLAESLVSARHHGVEQDVIDSLQDLLPGVDWHDHARYMISRALTHGRRRAEEMREAAKAVAEAGLTPWMSEACVERQDWAANRRHALDRGDLAGMLDAMGKEA